MSAPLPHEPQGLLRLLTRAERLTTRRLQGILETEGCSVEAWRVLSLLSDGVGHHMTEISEQAFLPPATLTKLTDQLVDENLVHRRIDAADRRRIRAHLTPRGRRLLQRVNERMLDGWDQLPVSADDQEALASLLTRLVDALDGKAVAASSRGAAL